MKDFEILSRDTVVAVWKDNELKVLNNDLLPLYLKRVSDAKTGDLLGLAPNFDNNMALIARGYPTIKSTNDLLITLFNELIQKYPEYKEYLPNVTEQTIKKVISKLNMKIKSQTIVDLVINRYNAIV